MPLSTRGIFKFPDSSRFTPILRNFSAGRGGPPESPLLLNLPYRPDEIIPSDGGAGGVEEIDSDFRRLGRGARWKRWLLSLLLLSSHPIAALLIYILSPEINAATQAASHTCK